MSQAPAFPFFIDAYLADTTHLTAEEHGAYLLLLFAMWRRDGEVPDDDRDNARVCGLSLRRWRAVKNSLGRLLRCENDVVSAPFITECRNRMRRRPIAKGVREEIFKKFGGRCAYCGAHGVPFHIDHVYPRSRGGSDAESNLALACVPCNLSKRDRTLEEWLQ